MDLPYPVIIFTRVVMVTLLAKPHVGLSCAFGIDFYNTVPGILILRETKAQRGLGHIGYNGRLEVIWLLPTLLLHHARAVNAPNSTFWWWFSAASDIHLSLGILDVCSVLVSLTVSSSAVLTGHGFFTDRSLHSVQGRAKPGNGGKLSLHTELDQLGLAKPRIPSVCANKTLARWF